MKLDFSRVEAKRQVLGYHGCLKERFEEVFVQHRHLPMSLEEHNWLGDGVYVWEHSPERAYRWACDMAKRKKRDVADARVVGVLFEMGYCLDLLDVAHTNLLAQAYEQVKVYLASRGIDLPQNTIPKGLTETLIRKLDCTVINFAINQHEERQSFTFQTVRGAFWEGEPAFEGSCIQTKSHVQIAIRDYNAILGYFIPGETCSVPSPSMR